MLTCMHVEEDPIDCFRITRVCSTLAAIKELVNRRHKELITMKNFEKG